MMFIQNDFNIHRCFERLGFKDIEKERDCLVIKDNISIYYYSPDKLSLTTNYSIDMKIFENGELLYHGLTPTSEENLLTLLDLIFPSQELINRINSRMLDDEAEYYISRLKI